MRKRWEMPGDVQEAITSSGLQQEYDSRPPYQRNDYIGWITKAKRTDTRQKSIEQMLSEVRVGNVYMKMSWSGQNKYSNK